MVNNLLTLLLFLVFKSSYDLETFIITYKPLLFISSIHLHFSL